MSYERISHAGGAVPTALTTGITSGDTTLDIDDTTGWTTLGTDGPFYLVVYELSGTDHINEEKIQATAISGTTLSGLTRGQDGTTAVTHIAGSIVEHIFTAAEADEANATVAAVLGQVAAKGDLLTGSAVQDITKTTVGADDTILIADSTAPGGVRWGTALEAIGTAGITANELAADSVGASEIAAGAVGASELASGILVEADFSSAYYKRTTFSVAQAGATGTVTIPHGASFTPAFVQIMFTAPTGPQSTTSNFAPGWVVVSIDATDVVIRMSIDTGVTAAGTMQSWA